MARKRHTLIPSLIAGVSLMVAGPAAARDVIIHAGTLIDGVSKIPRKGVSIVIHDDRIVRVEPGYISPPDALVIDLAGETVLPGFIDMHDHPTNDPDEGPASRFMRSDAQAAIWAVVNARHEIETGFTTVRDVGSGGTAIPVLNSIIARGMLIGPRMWPALEPLSATGGHADPLNGPPNRLTFADRDLFVVDGADEVRKQVREHHRRGAKILKLMVSGGVGSVDDDPNLLLMTDDEMRTAVETAHSLGMTVAAHVHGKLAIDHAVRAGVDSIEHGTFADAETYALMKEHGTFLVPTLLVGDDLLKTANEHPERLRPTVAEKAKAVIPIMSGNAHRAYLAGVKIALGTDFSASAGRNKAEEFGLMVKAGIPPIDAILAGTSNAAQLLHDAQDVGAIKSGAYADIVAVHGDPLENIRVLETVQFVMKGGEIIKQNGKLIL